MPNVRGRRPIPDGTEIALWTSQEVRKVALGPLQPTPDDTHLRVAARAPLQPVLPFTSFRELPLMTPAHLAEPLPASAVPA